MAIKLGKIFVRINRENLEKLPELVSEIHDMWFSVDELVFDEATREFRLYFGQKKDRFDHCLQIKGVMSCRVKDTEKVGIYDIHYLSVDMKKSLISIVGCIPITISLEISPDFEIITKEANP